MVVTLMSIFYLVQHSFVSHAGECTIRPSHFQSIHVTQIQESVLGFQLSECFNGLKVAFRNAFRIKVFSWSKGCILSEIGLIIGECTIWPSSFSLLSPKFKTWFCAHTWSWWCQPFPFLHLEQKKLYFGNLFLEILTSYLGHVITKVGVVVKVEYIYIYIHIYILSKFG